MDSASHASADRTEDARWMLASVTLATVALAAFVMVPLIFSSRGGEMPRPWLAAGGWLVGYGVLFPICVALVRLGTARLSGGAPSGRGMVLRLIGVVTAVAVPFIAACFGVLMVLAAFAATSEWMGG